jgi:DNA-binding NtrC family response regulator
MGSGSELLIVDGAERDREGMRKYFDAKGYVCTAVGTGDEARRFITQKFFPAALVDLDVDGSDSGILLVHFIREKSPETTVVLTTSRASFEGAVAALRAGVADVVRKTKEDVPHLERVVRRASERYRVASESDDLHREIRGVLDESFKVMLGMSRKVYSHLSLAAAPLKPKILVVDDDQELLRELSQLIQGKDWEIAGEMNGGAALDRGMSSRLDVIVSRDELPDLRGSMVIRSIQAQAGEVVGLLYSSADGGRIDRMEQGQVEGTDRPFTGPKQLVAKIQEVVDELGTRTQERRFIQAFSSDHREFLRRYAELKLKIDRLITD